MQLRCVSQGMAAETPLVLYGPLASTGSFWRPLLPALAQHGAVYVSEYPGCKGVPAMSELTVQRLAELALEELQRAGLARAHLVGHSFGGWVAQQVAQRAPERVASLALLGSSLRIYQLGIGLFNSWLKIFDAMGPETVLVQMAGWSLSPLTLESNPDLLRLFVDASLRTFEEPSGLRSQLAAAIQYTQGASLHGVNAPTLLLRGELDAMAPQPCVEELQVLLPQAQAVQVPRAGHALLLEQPRLSVAALVTFWEGVKNGAARSR